MTTDEAAPRAVHAKAMMDPETFEEYWVEFVRSHTRKGTQWAHLVGNLASLAIAASAIRKRRWWLLLAAPLPAVAAARLSHVLLERGVPLRAARHPLWLLRSEARMAKKLLLGSMQEEVERVLAERAGAADHPDQDP
jgi:hypothetical protein